LFTTIVLALLLLATVAAFVFLPKVTLDPGTSYQKQLSRGWAAIPLVLLLVGLVLTCTTTVSGKSEGVLLTFKKPSERVLDSGLSVKAPWQSVVEVDGTRKTDNYNDGDDRDDEDPTQNHAAIKCRLADNGVATVYATIQWARAEGSSNRVYSEYRSDDPVEAMRENLVSPRFKESVNEACGEYRPTGVIDQLDVDFSDPVATAKALKGLKLAPDFEALSRSAEDKFEAKLGDDPLVTVEHIAISYMSLPDSSQDQIQAFQDEAAKARTALLSQATAAAEARANSILSDSISEDPNVLVSKCWTAVAEGKISLPAGVSCWPGGGSSVVVPSAK